MLSEFLLSKPNLLEELFRIVGWGVLLLGTLSSAFYMVVQVFKGEGFYYRNIFEHFFLLIATTFVWVLLIGFVSFGFYNVTKTFIAYQYADGSKDTAVVKKYYDTKPKYGKLEFTLKDPSSYSDVFKDKIAVPILHEDSKEYQVEYNEHIYKIEK
jgi:hypothetical protein